MEGLKGEVDKTLVNDLYQWMREKFDDFVDFGLSKGEVEKFNIQQTVSPVTKITATVKAIPDKRRQIRKKINDEQIKFTEILNEFIDKAKESLSKKQQSKLVVIADNLDRIPIIRYDDSNKNLTIIVCSSFYKNSTLFCIYSGSKHSQIKIKSAIIVPIERVCCRV